MVGIYFIAKHNQFNWQKMIQIANQKDSWVEPLNIARLLETFSRDNHSSQMDITRGVKTNSLPILYFRFISVE